MKKLFFSIFLGLTTMLVMGQEFTVSGTITDETGIPLPGVTVTVKGTSTGTQSDFEGRYSLSLTEGSYVFVISYGAYGGPEELRVQVFEDSVVNYQIGQREVLDEVFLSAIRVSADSPITHSNVDKEEIEKRNLGQDLPILLNYLPAVVTTSDAGAGIGYTGIRVRGSDASRVNVTINGIPYNDSESQGTFWVNLPDFSSSVESIQLQRGVGTSTNGSGAFGASLNILSDGVQEEAFGQLSNSYGSFNTWKHTAKFGTGLLKDKVELVGRLSKIESDGYIDRASSDLKSYFLQGTYKGDNTLLKALVFGGKEITYQSWFGIDAATLESDRTFNPAGARFDADGNLDGFHPNQVDNYTQDHYQLLWNQRYDNNWSTNVTLNYTYGRGFFEEYENDADLDFHGLSSVEVGGETISSADLIRRRWLDNNYYAANANVNYKNDRWDTSTGVFYSYYEGLHFGEVIWSRFNVDGELGDQYYFGTGDKHEFTAFSKATFQVNDQWSVYGDLQARIVNYKTGGLTSDKINLLVDETFEFFNPKFGASFSLNDTNQFYFSYGRANREPRRSDFENGVTKAEKLDDYELGWRFNSEKVQVNTNLYYMDYQDQLVLTGELDNSGAPVRATSGKSYRLGLEVDAAIQLGDKVTLRPNIAVSSNKNKDFVTSRDGSLVNLGNTNISFSPSVIAGNSLEYAPVGNLRLAFLSKYVGEQYMGNIDSETSKLDSYFINDFNVSYTIENVPFAKSIVLSGLVNNLFNVEYISNGYFFTYDDDFSNPGTITTIEGAGFYPQATINFLVGATVNF
ncbi:TonB-dependent receptor [Aureisphaera galaxeae]|uniref:TonB-dependent receptor n=1 Tax=Aureisphaera galaxeae TaxID=1538023 RepID=UPI00235010CF|nr:TonB-dependent receptor [Aureisphaera galaxeae]MDC8002754.1 TonB-dependent receptor [Aureisphaera galaxeae]